MFSLFLFLAILIYGVETTKKLIEHGMPFGTVQWALAALVVAMFISEIFLGIKLIKQQKINKAERKVYLEEQKAIESRRRREFFMDDFSNETCDDSCDSTHTESADAEVICESVSETSDNMDSVRGGIDISEAVDVPLSEIKPADADNEAASPLSESPLSESSISPLSKKYDA